MLIKHIRTQGVYLVGDINYSLSIDGKHYTVTPYVPVPNEDSVLYLREPNNFDGFENMGDCSDIQILSLNEYKTIKFKQSGQWQVVPASSVNQH